MRLIPLALLAAASVAVGGCGGDGEQSTPVDVAPEFFGIAPQDAISDVDLTRMAAGKIGSYHLLLSWPRVQSQEGVYDFAAYDELIGKLARFGLEPITYVFGTPALFADESNMPPTVSTEALRAWDDFLVAAAERYGPGGEFWEVFARTDPGVEPRPLRIWEIWNEPNGPAFWNPDPSPADYATLLKRSERALHSVDPEAQIMVAGMFATPSKPGAILATDFLRELFEQPNLAEAVNLVGIHPYGPSLADVEGQMEDAHAILERAGVDDRGVWVTEIGWGSNPRAANPLAKTPARQATLLRRAYELMLSERRRWNVQGVLWYTWRDAANPVGLCGWCSSAGLVDNDLDAKPAWIEYTSFTGGEAGP